MRLQPPTIQVFPVIPTPEELRQLGFYWRKSAREKGLAAIGSTGRNYMLEHKSGGRLAIWTGRHGFTDSYRWYLFNLHGPAYRSKQTFANHEEARIVATGWALKHLDKLKELIP